MDRVYIQNPNAALFELESSGTLDMDITNSYINVEEYGISYGLDGLITFSTAWLTTPWIAPPIY